MINGVTNADIVGLCKTKILFTLNQVNIRKVTFDVFYSSVTRSIVNYNSFHWRSRVAKASQTTVVPHHTVIGYYYGEYFHSQSVLPCM